jgi:intraflagellar transport protein 140
MKEMRQRIPNVNLTYYIDIQVIENIHTAMDVPMGRGVGAEEREEKPEEEDGEEEVESDVEGGF